MTAASLRHYWRTNAAIAAGVAVAVAVLGGAAAVGVSVERSLRDLALGRLGGVRTVASGPAMFREALAGEGAAPILAFEGAVQAGAKRAFRVSVYGVDGRFWKLVSAGDAPDGVEVSEALARELELTAGSPLIVRVEKPSAIPREWLHGRRDDAAKAIRLVVGGVRTAERGGSFSLELSQRDVRAVFVPLGRLQRELDVAGRASAILSAGAIDAAGQVTLDDLGLQIKGDVLESRSAVMPDALVAGVVARDARARPSLTYLANGIRVGERNVPYSLVTAIDRIGDRAVDGLLLNEWAARELGAKLGDPVTLEYFVWKDDGRLETATATMPLAGVIAIDGEAARRDFTPDYPGLTDADTLGDWDPPFPVDLKRVRPVDEEYWKKYRTTPKAFVPLEAGRRLWSSRFGSTTSVRLSRAPANLSPKALGIDPVAAGVMVRDVRAEAIAASRGSTDFGGYFAAFSFFLVVAAVMLAAVFFRLGVEQRVREVGLLRATGFTPAAIRWRFLREGAIVAGAGCLAGAALAPVYAGVVLEGLRTWWSGASGTSALTLHFSPMAALSGALIALPVTLIAMAATLRRLNRSSARELLAGVAEPPARARQHRWFAPVGIAAALGAAGTTAAAMSGAIDKTGGFFGAGFLALAAGLIAFRRALVQPPRTPASSIGALAWRSMAHRPARATWCALLIAMATFLLISTGAFRRSDEQPGESPLYAESMTPLYHDPNTPDGAESLLLPRLDAVRFTPFRLKPGDDASCLNLFQPRQPRVLGAPDEWMRARGVEPGKGGALVDANSLEYILHKKAGDTIEIDGAEVRIAGTLHDSVFQSELLIAASDFRRLFPYQQGYQVFLIDAPPAALDGVTRELETALSDYGFDVERTASRLAAYHRVENTYLATFQALGALGLLLGVAGLGALLLRNVLESRRELALLRAVGWTPRSLARLIAAETAMLLGAGLAIGGIAAVIAVAPAMIERGGGAAPVLWLAALAAGVFTTGMLSGLAAARAASSGSLTEALRSE